MTYTASLTDRSVIALDGADSIPFLNGLISQDVAKVTPEQPLYGCLLTPQGKYLADFMIGKDGDRILLDVAASRKDVVLQRLRMFVLRSKVTLTDVTVDYQLYAAWNSDTVPEGFYRDPRWSGLGFRAITQQAIETNVSLNDYHVWRTQNGVPDVADIDIERTALLEANIDQLHGIDWDKGCYMGQELTARTHYRGLIKKRLLPFRFEGPAPDYDTSILMGSETIGHTRGIAGSYGIALVKMEYATAALQEIATISGQVVQILKPDWMIISH